MTLWISRKVLPTTQLDQNMCNNLVANSLNSLDKLKAKISCPVKACSKRVIQRALCCSTKKWMMKTVQVRLTSSRES